MILQTKTYTANTVFGSAGDFEQDVFFSSPTIAEYHRIHAALTKARFDSRRIVFSKRNLSEDGTKLELVRLWKTQDDLDDYNRALADTIDMKALSDHLKAKGVTVTETIETI